MGYEVIGKPVLRYDGLSKISGQAVYTDDVTLPELLYAKILHSPYAHAEILNIDTSKAEAANGVRCVVTNKDALGDLPGMGYPDHPILADDKVRYVGDEVAMVVAISEDIANEALDLIEVEYKELTPVFDPREALKPNAPQLYETGNVLSPFVSIEGDVEQGLKGADKTFSAEFHFPSYKVSVIQPQVLVSSWDGDRVDVWWSSQALWELQERASQYFKIPANNIRIIGKNNVGGFGSRGGHLGRIEMMNLLASRKAKKPVMLQYTRKEEVINGYTRKQTYNNMKIGVKNDGTITAVDYSGIHDIGGLAYVLHAMFSPDATFGYTVPNTKFEVAQVYTNKSSGGGFRGWGKEYGILLFQTMLDMIAEELNMDIIDLQLKNLYKAGDVMRGQTYNFCGVRDCVNIGAEKFGWKNRTHPSTKTGVVRTGMGMAVHMRDGGQFLAEAIVRVNKDGTIYVMNGCHEIGNGIRTAIAQIAAETLGASYEQVTVPESDTMGPYSRDSGASSGTRCNGYAVMLAAQDVKKKILEKAAEIMEVDAESLDLRIRDSIIFVKEKPEQNIALADVFPHHPSGLTIFNQYDNFYGIGQGIPSKSMITGQAIYTEVEVDTESGMITLKRMLAVVDPGTTVNPMILSNNLWGGCLMGSGITLREEIILDPDTGYVLNAGYTNHPVPTFLDYQQIDKVEFVNPGGEDPYGISGPSEAFLCSVKPSILNAIYNAIGVRFDSLPITPNKVLEALGKI